MYTFLKLLTIEIILLTNNICEATQGGVCAPLIPENNALISPTPWKKSTSAPWKYFSFAPQIPKINSASPQIPENISLFSLKLIESIMDNRYLWCFFLILALENIEDWTQATIHEQMT